MYMYGEREGERVLRAERVSEIWDRALELTGLGPGTSGNPGTMRGSPPCGSMYWDAKLMVDRMDRMDVLPQDLGTRMGCCRPTMQGCEVRGPAVDLQLHQVPLELEGGPAGGDAVVATTRTFARSALLGRTCVVCLQPRAAPADTGVVKLGDIVLAHAHIPRYRTVMRTHGVGGSEWTGGVLRRILAN